MYVYRHSICRSFKGEMCRRRPFFLRLPIGSFMYALFLEETVFFTRVSRSVASFVVLRDLTRGPSHRERRSRRRVKEAEYTN